MKPEIEWICTTSVVDKVMPVIRASEYKHMDEKSSCKI